MVLLAVGVSAPAIEVGEWVVGKPESGDWVLGKNIILEFWGTQCAPCISAMPHLNKLAEKYGSERTVFVSLAHDDPGAVRRFLEKRILKGSVATDRDGLTFKAYGVRGIPHTILIDPHGVLRWQGHPNLFTEALLKEFLEHNKVPEVQTAPEFPASTVLSTQDSVFTLRISPNTTGPRGYGAGGGDKECRVEYYGCQVVDAIRNLLDQAPARMRTEGVPPTELLDIELRATLPMKPAVAKNRVVDILCDLYDISLSRVWERREGWRMTCPNPRLTDMSELGGGMGTSSSLKEVTATNVTIEMLAKTLEPVLGTILVNGTQLPGKYDFSLPVETFDAARESLAKDYGILLEPEECHVEMLVLAIPESSGQY